MSLCGEPTDLDGEGAEEGAGAALAADEAPREDEVAGSRDIGWTKTISNILTAFSRLSSTSTNC